MTGLSIPVICSVVLVLQTFCLTPVLPSVTPDLHLHLQRGELKENLEYEIVPGNEHISSRLKRQVTFAPDDGSQPLGDKALLNKSPAVTFTKKPLDIQKSSSPTVLPQENSSTNLNGINTSGLPTPESSAQPNTANNNNAVTSDQSEEDSIEGFPHEELLFDNNSTYPHILTNTTYYDPGQNVTIKKVDDYKYYRVHHDTDGYRKYWVSMDGNPKAKKHDMLSNAHRRAATVKPNFPILFYGHKISNLTIATGGFVYLGDQVHAWLAATQYVAPLMSNFMTTTANSTVHYVNADNYFTVEWNQVRLQDSPQVGPFTFQTTLYKNGTIVFVYKTIPIAISAINDTNHPVKVGLSDAYIKDKNMLFVRQKTIYEYDRIDMKSHPNATITNGSAIIFEPFTTCLQAATCEECVNFDPSVRFKCAWCPATNRCSNGTDRFYQEWTQRGCDKASGNFTSAAQCAAIRKDTSSTYNVATDQGHDIHDGHDHHDGFDGHGAEEKTSVDSYVKKVKAPESQGMSAAGVIGVMFLLMLVFGAVGWLAYAYFFPHSPSGQVLIRYRPSQWAFRRGEARYTAASIHM